LDAGLELPSVLLAIIRLKAKRRDAGFFECCLSRTALDYVGMTELKAVMDHSLSPCFTIHLSYMFGSRWVGCKHRAVYLEVSFSNIIEKFIHSFPLPLGEPLRTPLTHARFLTYDYSATRFNEERYLPVWNSHG